MGNKKLSNVHYSRTMTTNNLSKAANTVGEWVLTGLGKVGQAFNGLLTAGASTDFGLTSPFVMSSMKERQAIQKGRLKALKKANEKIAQGMTWVSPLNYGAALATGHGLNAKKGEEEVASWSPAWLAVGRVGELYLSPKGVKAATKNGKAYVISRTIDKAVRKNTPKADNRIRSIRIDDKTYDYSSNPLLEFVKTIRTSPENSYFMRAPELIDITKLRNGRFRHEVVGDNIIPSGSVDGKFVSYGEPWLEFYFSPIDALYEFPIGKGRGPSMMATDWKGRPKNYSVDEAYNYMQQERALRKELSLIEQLIGKKEFNSLYYYIRKNLVDTKYPLLKEHIDTSIYGANQTVIPNKNWNFNKFLNSPFYKYTVNSLSNTLQKELFIPGTLKSAKQQRVISEKTYPWYRGKQHSIKEVVNPDGTINPRLAMKILHEVSELFPGSYKMEHRLENPEWHETDLTTYDHTKNVALSAWGLDVPYGFTKYDLMVAALGHDFGKIVAGDGHAQIGADLAKQVFPDLTDAQYAAIAEHMGTPKTSLGKATKAADIDNGRSVGLNSSPLTDTYVETYKLNNSVEPRFDRSKLGRMIGRGTEQRVYDGGNGYVYKIYGKNVPNSTIKDLRGMIDTYSLRNNVDINLPVSYEGYIYNNRGQYLPVFKQKKVTIPQKEDYQQAIDMMEKRRKLLGYKLSSDVLHNKNYGIFDLYPGNFGIDGGLIFVIDGPTIPRVPGTGLFNENLPGISNSLRDNIKFVNELGGKSIEYDN